MIDFYYCRHCDKDYTDVVHKVDGDYCAICGHEVTLEDGEDEYAEEKRLDDRDRARDMNSILGGKL
jgi:uncharacterized Zn finger protein (UPF0148 family)